ncbi:hypothetical protein M422DRAFT_785088 [Sphaerobolus stellatus SS14]|uniref:Uncharacterized protein n=1 Tax=Sphaerobolus stellatus (strain SS14) TaxID=990650 RepID=A0A0C9UNC5_SPHS4|nr:hypothetical protein M422DRAFT_785088 [Sphaerobolus stellatus SS14]
MSNPPNEMQILTNAPRIHCIPLSDVTTPVGAVGAYSVLHMPPLTPPQTPPRPPISLNAPTVVRPAAAARIAGPTYAPQMRPTSLPDV